MRTLLLAAAAAVTLTAVPAMAQDMGSAPTADAAPGEPAAPDGSKFFGFVPYFGVMGGYETFDNEPNGAGIPQAFNANGTRRNNYHIAGALVQGVAGANLPLGPGFVGGEGFVAKGVSGNIDWEYGAAVRAGFRAGDSGQFYFRLGYKWINLDRLPAYTVGSTNHDYHGWEPGIGMEVGPKDIGLGGLTGNAGFRLRGEVDTMGDFHSIRPMLGVIAHF